MKIAYLYLPHRIERLPLVSSGKCPTEFFYGAIELRQMGHHVGLFEVIEKPRRSMTKYIAEKFLSMKYLPPKVHVGMLDAVGLLLPKLGGYEVLVGTTSDISLSLGIWRRLGKLPKEILGIQCGLLNYGQNAIRNMLTGVVLKQIHSQIFGYGELNGILQTYRADPRRVEVNLFGVDERFWSPAKIKYSEEYVLSLGSDARRDFDTLVRAARRHPQTRFLIITKRTLKAAPPENVQVIRSSWGSREIDDLALRRLYRRAACVVVPLRPTIQPSGQSVALQAMACEKPVILTRTAGLWENRNLKDGENIRFVPPGDHRTLSEALSEILKGQILRSRLGRKGRQYVMSHARIDFFARRIEKRCRLLMEKQDVA